MRSRREATIDPEITRELSALDAALRDEPVEAELAALVHDVRAQRPQPSDAFVQRLEAQVRSGFASGRPRARFSALRARMSRRMLLPALGAAATLLLGIVVATSVIDGNSGSNGSADRELAGPSATPQSAPVDLGAAAAGEPVIAARKIERRASLTLVAPADRIDDVSDDVVRVTDRFDGIVLSSSVSSGDGSRAGAEFRLRVPSERAQPALAALSKLAHVRSRTENADDITTELNATKGRLDEALAERSSLLRQLARASTPNEAAAIRARLRINGQQITQARAALKSVRERTSFSVLEVTIVRGRERAGGAWTPGDALDDALGVLTVTLGIVLVALSVLLPLGLVGGLGVLAARGMRRRRREQALAQG